MWKLNLNARLKLFLWKIAWDIVPSRARLNCAFPISPSNSLCPLCLIEVDSLPHLFFNYIFARIAWRTSFWPLDSLAWSSLSLSSWVKGIINPHTSFSIPLADSHLFQVFATVLCDLLWFSRNKAIHDGVVPDVLTLAKTIKKTSLEHAAAWKSVSPITEVWFPPAAGFFELNFNTAIREKFSTQATVCRESKGRIIKAISQISPPCAPKYGEALAALLVANLAVSLQLKNFSIEGDSLLVDSALQHHSLSQDWQIENIISKFFLILPSCPSWEAKKVNRCANLCAHHVAYWTATRVFSGYIPTFFSSSSFPHPSVMFL